MKEISLMSRAELVRELIASIPTTAETAATYAENRDSLSPTTRDALVCHKLAVARELLLRDLAKRMKAEPVLTAPAVVREWLQLYCANLEHEVFIVLLLDLCAAVKNVELAEQAHVGEHWSAGPLHINFLRVGAASRPRRAGQEPRDRAAGVREHRGTLAQAPAV